MIEENVEEKKQTMPPKKWHPEIFKIPSDKIFRENLRRFIVEITPLIENRKFEDAVLITYRYINNNIGKNDGSVFYFAGTLLAIAASKKKDSPTNRAIKNLNKRIK